MARRIGRRWPSVPPSPRESDAGLTLAPETLASEWRGASARDTVGVCEAMTRPIADRRELTGRIGGPEERGATRSAPGARLRAWRRSPRVLSRPGRPRGTGVDRRWRARPRGRREMDHRSRQRLRGLRPDDGADASVDRSGGPRRRTRGYLRGEWAARVVCLRKPLGHRGFEAAGGRGWPDLSRAGAARTRGGRECPPGRRARSPAAPRCAPGPRARRPPAP